jgi:hypothetical protein
MPGYEAASDELRGILAKISDKQIQRIEPSLEPSTGLVFKGFEDHDYNELSQMLDALEQDEVLTREPFDSFLKCRSCDSYCFSTQFVCTVCRSSNIMRGAVIEHLTCGNIDLEEKYSTNEGFLVCGKCSKRLNAIGVDYSRPGFFYRCQGCKATLPDAQVQYTCAECGNHSTMDQLPLQQLFAYTVDYEKISTLLKRSSILKSTVEILGQIGIKSVSPGEFSGLSKIKHSFELVVFNDEDIPILLAEVLGTEQGLKRPDEARVMAFHARCDDISRRTRKTVTRTLIALPELKEEAGKLANTLGITIIQSDTKEQAISQVIQLILKAYVEDKKMSATIDRGGKIL